MGGRFWPFAGLGMALLVSLGCSRPSPDPSWVYLSDQPWVEASTGWLAVGNSGLPTRDTSFTGAPLNLGQAEYGKGLGTYPLSEIVYLLDEPYAEFLALVGLDDQVPPGEGGVRFLVFLDDTLLYESLVLKGGDWPERVSLPLGPGRELRLVTIEVAPGPNYAAWAEAKLRKPTPGEASPPPSAWAEAREARHAARSQRLREHRERGRQELSGLASYGVGSQAAASFVEADHPRRLVLSSQRLALTLGWGGPEHGRLSLLELPTSRLILDGAGLSFTLTTGQRYRLATDTQPNGDPSLVAQEEPPFGHGWRLRAPFATKDGAVAGEVELCLFDGSSYFLYQVVLTRLPPEAALAEVSFFDLDTGGLFTGAHSRYLADYSRLREVKIRDDGLLRGDVPGPGKPVYIGPPGDRGVLLALLDEATSPTRFALRLGPGEVMASLELRSGPTRHGAPSRSPRLLFDASPSPELSQAFANYRAIMTQLYPPPPLPHWVRYQWLSWYAYEMDINEEKLRHQIDFIAENLADLGPWHIIIDAGWYLAEGRPGAEWRRPDQTKFPSGLKALVDYAHSKGVKVVLYFSTPYLDSQQRPGDWLGLRGLIEEHPDWLILLGEDESRASFAYDYSHPELRQYMRQVLEDFFLAYGVDGMKVDGLGNAEGALLTPRRVDSFGLVDRVHDQTLDIYRFTWENAQALRPNLYLESGWLTPALANPYAHTFRYGDEIMAFSSPYPGPGLLEHIEYAAFQQHLLGQRANIGAVYEGPNDSILNRWWLGAALALDAQGSLSFDLTQLDTEALSRYRALLVGYQPFSGTTVVQPAIHPQAFATTRGDALSLSKGEVTYLGLLNRGPEGEERRVHLADLGLREGPYLVYDVEEGSFRRVGDGFSLYLPPSSFRLLVLRHGPGVVWTNSSYQVTESSPQAMVLKVRGPVALPGFLHLDIPPPIAAYLDGVALPRQADPAEGFGLSSVEGYSYDEEMGVLSLRYQHQGEREVRVLLAAPGKSLLPNSSAAQEGREGMAR